MLLLRQLKKSNEAILNTINFFKFTLNTSVGTLGVISIYASPTSPDWFDRTSEFLGIKILLLVILEKIKKLSITNQSIQL